MTTEQKAKAYDKALERASRIKDNNTVATPQEVAEHIFPELRESESERIRKWLVDYFGLIKEVVWINRDITCEQILEWLEKQKEQKPNIVCEQNVHYGQQLCLLP